LEFELKQQQKKKRESSFSSFFYCFYDSVSSFINYLFSKLVSKTYTEIIKIKRMKIN